MALRSFTMRVQLALALLSCLGAAAAAAATPTTSNDAPQQQQQQQPNMIILLGDDWGWGDQQFPLGDSPAFTPNLLAMAGSSNGVHFPRFYIGGSVCSPTRSTVLTGRTNTRDCVINVEVMALPLQLQGGTIADYAKANGYDTLFGGKWHLGSNANDTSPENCYDPALTNNTCYPGYIHIDTPSSSSSPSPAAAAAAASSFLCCDGRDALVAKRTPLDFGFQNVLATSQVAPSSNSNCGCLMTVPGAGEGCNMGHYAGEGHMPSYLEGLECDQYFQTLPNGSWVPVDEVTPVDDAAYLVGRLESFILQAVQNNKPFLAQVSFHAVHIPYIAPPEFRALYPNYTINEQDYYGAISNVDAQIGRIRNLLANLGIANNTLLAFTTDNGPEVTNAGGHECTPFPNPGSTNGLQGRKRALLEGGIRVPGIIEAPFLVKNTGPIRLDHFAASTIDYLPTFMDMINASNVRPSWPLDGISLVPALSGQASVRPVPIGWLSDFPLANATDAADCPESSAAKLPPNAPTNYTTPVNQAQVAWSEGPLKLIGCRNKASNWMFRLFNVETDPYETTDLFDAQLPTVEAMYTRLSAWQDSVMNSRNVESQCASQP